MRREKEAGQEDHASCSVKVHGGWEAGVGDLGEEVLRPSIQLMSEARS